MKLNPIAFAIPVFFAAIGLELWLSRRRKVRVLRFSDAVANLGCGIGNQVMALLFGALLLGIYARTHQSWSLVHFEAGSVWPWVIGLLGLDFLYYWWHRLSHEVNFMWAAHVVHHQSEDYNLAVALRQAYFTSFTILPFYLVLAFAGVPMKIYATCAAISLLYQFWIHTELIGKLPRAFELVFNTPSHHRVHHGTNPEYLDRNHGGILIVWDRLFGTFEPERAPATYGITKPLRSFNPVWANLHYWVELWQLARGAPSFARAARVFVAAPGWDPQTGSVLPPPYVPREQVVKFDGPTPDDTARAWIMVQLGLLAFALIALLLFVEEIRWPYLAAGGAAIIAATAKWAAILEGRSKPHHPLNP